MSPASDNKEAAKEPSPAASNCSSGGLPEVCLSSSSSSGGLPEVCLSSSDDSKDSSPVKTAGKRNSVKDASLLPAQTNNCSEDKDASTLL